MLPERVETHTATLTEGEVLSTVRGVNWLTTESVDRVRWLVIDRPDTKNAIPVDGWAQLHDAFVDFERGDDRVLVVTGAGGEFCSGAELDPGRYSGDLSVMSVHQRMKLVERAATALHTTTKPTIAAVDGVAVGAGMNLALGCDIVVATERARFSEIFVRRGLTVDFAGTWLLPRVVGSQRAKELALSGRIVDAKEALAIGLVLEVVTVEDLRGRVTELAESFLAGAPLGQRFAKQGLNAAFESSFAESVSWEGQSQAILFSTEDVVEGVTAFVQKRPPEWKGS